MKTFKDIEIPSIYKHFKGGIYATMDVSIPMSSNNVISLCRLRDIDPLSLIFMSANNTETNEDIRLLRMNNNTYHLEEECKDELMIYKSLYNGSGAYARPIDMFLSKVDKEKYPDVEQEYRFELIK